MYFKLTLPIMTLLTAFLLSISSIYIDYEMFSADIIFCAKNSYLYLFVNISYHSVHSLSSP